MVYDAYDPLKPELRTLASILRPFGIPLIVGGGYGLLLRYERVRQSGERTLMSGLPTTRSTEDIDVFLKAEIIVDPEKTKPIREALNRQHYAPVAKNFQFARSVAYGERERLVKIDFLAAPVRDDYRSKVKADDTRIRPHGYKDLHARITPEAFTVEEFLSPVDVGKDNDVLIVYLPHPFSYLLLKLFALRDQIDDPEKVYGRHHAYDLYTTIAMTTEEEWVQALQLRGKYSDTEQVIEARTIVNDLFVYAESLGMLRLREHARTAGYELPDRRLAEFAEILQELFPVL